MTAEKIFLPHLSTTAADGTPKHKSCNNCIEFCRVNEENPNQIQLRGFCKKGMLTGGDWSLYSSSSVCYDCPSYQYANAKRKLIDIEEKLSDLNFERKLGVPFNGDIKDFFSNQKTSFTRFCEIHREDIDFVRNSADLTKQEYITILERVAAFLIERLGGGAG